jgi:DNA-binding XRE family transcriptional regulator
MPAYTPLTKQDLLQKLKEQEEAHKLRRLDLLQRVKTLEARKKYVKELKAWLERRKLSTTDLLAMYRELQPKRADRPVKSKNPLQPLKRKSAGEQLVDAMREQRMVEIDAGAARDLIEQLGFKRASYSHIINNAILGGLLRRGEKLKNGPGYSYVVTGATAEEPPKPTGKVANRAVKIHGNGDPAFCKAIREARVAKGWTGEEAGKRLNVSSASIANWESGRYTPKEDARQEIVKLYGLPDGLGKEATAAATSKMGGKGHKANANGQAALI